MPTPPNMLRARTRGITRLSWSMTKVRKLQLTDTRHDLQVFGVRLTHVESTPLVATMESSRTHGPQQGAALMKRTTKYVALDVHQAMTVVAVRDDSGRVIARTVLPTEAPALVEFFRGMRGS